MTAIENPFDRRLLFDHPDPYPLFAMLRQSQLVLATTHQGRPTFLLTKYDDCLAALQDAETYSSRSNAEAGQVLRDGHLTPDFLLRSVPEELCARYRREGMGVVEVPRTPSGKIKKVVLREALRAEYERGDDR